MTNFERIKAMDISEMAQLIDMIESNSARNPSEFVETDGLDINDALDDIMWDVDIIDWLKKEHIERERVLKI